MREVPGPCERQPQQAEDCLGEERLDPMTQVQLTRSRGSRPARCRARKASWNSKGARPTEDGAGRRAGAPDGNGGAAQVQTLRRGCLALSHPGRGTA